MRWILVLVCLVMTACSGSFFRVSQEEYRERVQTLGVVPILVDADSNFNHPKRSELVDLLRQHNAGKEVPLVETLRAEKGHFDVRPVQADASSLQRLLDRSQQVEAGESTYRSYSFDPQEVSKLASREVVDALLVTVMYGEKRREKRWERNTVPTNYLETDYNIVAVTAAVVTPEGEVLWEFPGMTEGPFLHLQYPAFDEAHFNHRDEVRVRNITIEGLDRALSEAGKGLFGRDDFPKRYRALFDEIAASLDPGLAPEDGKKNE